MRFPWNAVTILGAVMLACAGGMAAWSWSEIAPTRNWATTEGRITGTGIDHVWVTGRSSSGWNYVPEFRYAYEVDGNVLRGDRGWPGTPLRWGKEDEARSFLRDFPTGRPIRVHYNPARPSEAALFLETSFTGAWICLVVGVLITLIGLAAEFGGRGSPRRRPARKRRKR